MGEWGRIYTTFRKLRKYYTCPATILVSFILAFDLWEHLQTRWSAESPTCSQRWASIFSPFVVFWKVFSRINCSVVLVHIISNQRRPESSLGCTQIWTDIFSSFTFLWFFLFWLFLVLINLIPSWWLLPTSKKKRRLTCTVPRLQIDMDRHLLFLRLLCGCVLCISSWFLKSTPTYPRLQTDMDRHLLPISRRQQILGRVNSAPGEAG